MNDVLKTYLVHKKPHALCVQAIQTDNITILPYFTLPDHTNKCAQDYGSPNHHANNITLHKNQYLPNIQNRKNQRAVSHSVLKIRNDSTKSVYHNNCNKRSHSIHRAKRIHANSPSAFSIQKRNNSVFLKCIDTETIIEFSPHNSNHISFTKIANRCVSTNKLDAARFDVGWNSQKLERFLMRIFPKHNSGLFCDIVKHKCHNKPLQ